MAAKTAALDTTAEIAFLTWALKSAWRAPSFLAGGSSKAIRWLRGRR